MADAGSLCSVTGGPDVAYGPAAESVARAAPDPAAVWAPAGLMDPLADHQLVLPPFRQIIGGGTPAFAHPFERDFARLLDYHRVRWAYEPTTFCLSRDGDGRPTEQFTPDFYLPDDRLYVELTSMRQRLVTRKHRKVRRLLRLFPNVRLKLLYRRDYARLLATHGPGPRAPSGSYAGLGPLVFSAPEIAARLSDLAAAVAVDHDLAGWGRHWGGGRRRVGRTEQGSLLVIGVGRGADRVQRAVVAGLTAAGVPCEADRLEVVRHRTPGGGRWVRLRRAPATPLLGRRVLLVEGAVSTGFSLAYLGRWLARRGAAAEVCALLDRRTARVADVPVRYPGFEAPPEILVGYGLDLRRQFRDLPYLAALAPE